MAKYKDIVGTAIRNNAGNIPTAETGQVWFDSTNIDFKYLFPATLSSWRTSGSLNTGRFAFAGIGIQTAGLAFGGETPGGVKGETEYYNGTSWTELNDLNLTRSNVGGAGTYTA